MQETDAKGRRVSRRHHRLPNPGGETKPKSLGTSAWRTNNIISLSFHLSILSHHLGLSWSLLTEESSSFTFQFLLWFGWWGHMESRLLASDLVIAFPLSFTFSFLVDLIWDLLCHEIHDEVKCGETAGLGRENGWHESFFFSF
jgi:hypothetical protein